MSLVFKIKVLQKHNRKEVQLTCSRFIMKSQMFAMKSCWHRWCEMGPNRWLSLCNVSFPVNNRCMLGALITEQHWISLSNLACYHQNGTTHMQKSCSIKWCKKRKEKRIGICFIRTAIVQHSHCTVWTGYCQMKHRLCTSTCMSPGLVKQKPLFSGLVLFHLHCKVHLKLL